MKILLEYYMTKKSLSESQVSMMTGLSRSTIHEIRKGSMPRVDTVELLAIGLHIKISDLLDSPYM